MFAKKENSVHTEDGCKSSQASFYCSLDDQKFGS